MTLKLPFNSSKDTEEERYMCLTLFLQAGGGGEEIIQII